MPNMCNAVNLQDSYNEIIKKKNEIKHDSFYLSKVEAK